MDIVVAQSSDEAFLIFKSCNKFEDGSGYEVGLRMRSDGFQLEKAFYFEEFSLQEFINGLSDMDRLLSGKATLKPTWDKPNYVELEVTSLGHVRITGEFAQFGDFEQRIKFGFETDQTCLAPLRDNLRRLAEQ